MCYVAMGTHEMCFFFFFNDTATTEIYTLSLHDALPICSSTSTTAPASSSITTVSGSGSGRGASPDRKSTRLNSSHSQISYAVFCLKKKKKLEEVEQASALLAEGEQNNHLDITLAAD